MTGKEAIITVDLHGYTVAQAKTVLDTKLRQADKSVYRIKVIHGYTRGTGLRDFVRKAYKNNPKVLRLELGLNQGETDLILRELI